MIEEELVSVKPARAKVANQMVIVRPLVFVNPSTTLSERNPLGTTQSMKKWGEDSLLNYHKYSFSSTIEEQFKTEKKMLTTYGQLKEKSKAKTQK